MNAGAAFATKFEDSNQRINIMASSDAAVRNLLGASFHTATQVQRANRMNHAFASADTGIMDAASSNSISNSSFVNDYSPTVGNWQAHCQGPPLSAGDSALDGGAGTAGFDDGKSLAYQHNVPSSSFAQRSSSTTNDEEQTMGMHELQQRVQQLQQQQQQQQHAPSPSLSSSSSSSFFRSMLPLIQVVLSSSSSRSR